jgi:O-antigen ligase
VSVATAPPPAQAGEQAPPTAVESPGPRRGGIIGLLLGAGVLAIGFTEFRPVLGGLGNLSDTLFLAAFALSAAWWFLTVDQRRLAALRDGLGEIQPLLWGGIAIALGGAVASFGSLLPSLSWSNTLKYVVAFCFWLPWVAYASGRYLSLRQVYVLYALSLGLVSAATLSDVLVRTQFGLWLVSGNKQSVIDSIRSGRYGGPVVHPNSLGFVAAIGFALCLDVAGRARTWLPRIAASLGVLFHVAALFISGSRSALIGIAATCVIFLIFGLRVQKWRLIGVVALSGVMLLGIAQVPVVQRFIPVNPITRLLQSVGTRIEFEADIARKADLQTVQDLLARDPFTGYGMDNIGTTANPTIGFTLHNTILQSWMAGGLLGAIGVLWLYFVLLSMAWRAVRGRHPLALGLFAASLSAVLIDQTQPHVYHRFTWFLAALLVATLRELRLGAVTTVGEAPQ